MEKNINDIVYFRYTNTDNWSVEGYSDDGPFPTPIRTIKIEDKIDGRPVTTISNQAFINSEYLQHVYLPKSVRWIGDGHLWVVNNWLRSI